MTMPGFVKPANTVSDPIVLDVVKPNKANFLATYVNMATSGANSGIIGAWLIENAKYMSEEMFEKVVDLTQLDPVHVLALRAVAPPNVFNGYAKYYYQARTSGEHKLFDLANIMFPPSTDLEFVRGVPEELRPQVLQLTQLAYRKGIRSPLAAVRDM